MDLMKTAGAVLSFIIAASACTGCTLQNDLPSDTAAGEITPFAPLTEPDPSKADVYLIIKNFNSSYWQVVADGVQQAGIDLGCNIYYSGAQSETEISVQEKLMEIAQESGADSIILAPNDSVRLSESVSRIHSSGTPVIIVDTAVNTPEHDICFMTDNLMAGHEAAAEMIRLLKEMGVPEDEKAEIGIQIGAANSQSINERVAGFCLYWRDNAPEKWTIIDDIMSNGGDADIAGELAEKMLAEHPDIRGLYGSNSGSAAGLASAVLSKQLTNVAVVGFDYSEDIAKLINSTEYHASAMLQQQWDMGYMAVKASLEILAGDLPEVKFRDMGVLILNKDTISLPEIRENLSRI